MSNMRMRVFKIMTILSGFSYFVGMTGWWLYKTAWGMDITVVGLFLFFVSLVVGFF